MAILRLGRRVKEQVRAAFQSADAHERSIAALSLAAHEPVSPARRSTILVNGWWALSSLTHKDGRGTYHDWDVLADSMNQARVLCALGFGPERAELLDAALAGVFRSEGRAGRVGRWGLDGDAKHAITQALLVYEAQLECIVQGDLARALILIDQRLREGQYQQ